MSQKRFTPSTTALVLIDHQFGTMQLVKTLDIERVKRHTLALARAARILSMPVDWTNFVGIDLKPYPNVGAYRGRIGARPKVQEALKAEGLLN